MKNHQFLQLAYTRLGDTLEEWARLPKPGGRLLGLSRTTLFELCEARAIKSTVIRKSGAVRGIRLIHVPSLLVYLDRSASGGPDAAAL